MALLPADIFPQSVAQARGIEQSGKIAEAEAACDRILEREPRNAPALFRRGMLAWEAARLEEAAGYLRRAVAAAPAEAAYHSAFGRVLQKQRLWEGALTSHAIAVTLAPQDAEIRFRLGHAQWEAGQFTAARATLGQAMQLDPAHAAAHRVMAQILCDLGFIEEGIAALRRQIAVETEPRAHDMLLFWLLFQPESTRASLHAEHAAWNERHAVPLRKFMRPHGNDPAPGRRLRIGYVSGDFFRHAVAHFLMPLFTHHDRERFEIVAYSGTKKADGVTARFKQAVDVWRDVADWPDEQLAAGIRADGIDLLVDLSLHTTHHRLLVFARRPAPVQVTWAGYPGGTGLDAIDYRLTDGFLDPEGESDAFYAEQSVRLPDCFWCYDPLGETPAVNALPALVDGVVTFGCLNKPIKINPVAVALWVRALRALPTARMILLAPPGAVRDRIAGLFRAQGIDLARIEFVGRQSPRDYYLLHHRIDVALDPVPYGGHTTLCDGLWMGVPTIALPGETAVARAGLSLLNNAGLPEWIAATPEDFGRIAVEQTRDLGRLAALRAGLRARVQASPLMDAARFARHVEAAYRKMWQSWCETRDRWHGAES